MTVTTTGPAGTPEPLSARYDTALLDLDGVVYAGGEAVEHAVASLVVAREAGMRLAFVTNNAARTPGTVADHLTRLGVPADAGEVVTSAQAVARMVEESVPPGAAVLCVGGEGLRVALSERGLRPVERADEDPAAVVQGYGGPGLTWGRLEEAALAVNRGVPWFASNTDLTIPTGRGVAPGNGAAVEVVRIATRHRRTPRVAGKPEPPMHRESVLRTGARRALVVGDRLDTDIEGATRAGVDSLLVLTGVTDAEQVLAAPPEHRPTYLAADLRGLLVPHQAPVPEGEGFRCGGWHARVRWPAEPSAAGEGGDGLLLAGSGSPADGLRALCAAAWHAVPAGGCELPAADALARLAAAAGE